MDREIKKMGKAWGEIEKFVMDRGKWNVLVAALCATGHEDLISK